MAGAAPTENTRDCWNEPRNVFNPKPQVHRVACVPVAAPLESRERSMAKNCWQLFDPLRHIITPIRLLAPEKLHSNCVTVLGGLKVFLFVFTGPTINPVGVPAPLVPVLKEMRSDGQLVPLTLPYSIFT